MCYISGLRSTWASFFLMNGQLETDYSCLVADWSLFNGTPVSLIKHKMNHRYPGPEEHPAQNLIVIGCVAAFRVKLCVCVREHFCGKGGQPQSYSAAHGCLRHYIHYSQVTCVCGIGCVFCNICADLLVDFNHIICVWQPSCLCSKKTKKTIVSHCLWFFMC